MATHLFGPCMDDVKRSLFRTTPDEDLDLHDALRFYTDAGEPLYLHAKGMVWVDDAPNLLSFITPFGNIEYVMTLDEACMIWTVVSGGRVKPPRVEVKNRASLS